MNNYINMTNENTLLRNKIYWLCYVICKNISETVTWNSNIIFDSVTKIFLQFTF